MNARARRRLARLAFVAGAAGGWRGRAYTAERRPVFLSLLARSLPSSVVPPQLTSLPLLHGDVEEFLLVVVFTAKGRFLAHGTQSPIWKNTNP